VIETNPATRDGRTTNIHVPATSRATARMQKRDPRRVVLGFNRKTRNDCERTRAPESRAAFRLPAAGHALLIEHRLASFPPRWPSLRARAGRRMGHFDDGPREGLGDLPIRCVSYSGVRRRRAQRLADQASSPPLPRGAGCVNRASHFRQRPRVDGILIDEMSF
jgi:hypothetical protein